MDIVEINETNFPDDVFRNDVKQFDLDRNGWLSEAEIAKVIEIDVSRYDTWVPEIKPPNRDIIVSLKGIEYFTELKSLLCDNNNIATLDVSNNIKLEKLICSRNQLTELDVQSNSELDHLDCNGNKLTELDLTENINLMKLGCSNNNLIKLNLSKNVQLRHLNCKYNNLTELDLTNNRALVFVWCDDVVTVTGWEAPMDIVEINEGNFPDEVFRADVREFDLDCNGWLSEAEIAKVTSINVNASSPVIAVYPLPPTREKIETLKGIEWFTALEYLDCGVNLLTELDISKNLHLKSLTCDDNLLTALDISHNTALISLSCSLNQLTNSGYKQKQPIRTIILSG